MRTFFLTALLFSSICLFATDDFSGYCLEFDGIDDYVEVGTSGSVGLVDQCTVEAWVNIPSSVLDGTRVGLILGNYGNSPHFNFEIHTEGRLRIYWNNGAVDLISMTDLRDDTWHHVAFVRDNSINSTKLYIDGNLISSASSGSNISVQWPLRVGADFRSTSPPGIPFHGKIDEVAIWNTARTQTDIQDSMINSLTGNEAALISYWQFNETAGSITYDAVGTNNGTLVNMTYEDHVISGAFGGILQGSGTVGDPYQIDDLSDLRTLSINSTFWSSHFIQTADIDAVDTQNWNIGAGFSPIGYVGIKFTGTYDGQGYEITNLYIDRSSSYYQGLFGYTYGSTISDLGVTNVDITGNYYTGSLVGYNYYNSDINNCYSSGSLLGFYYTGGLIGESYYSDINECYSTASVSGSGYTGGLIGYNYYNNTINESFSAGIVNGTSLYVGGLIGYNYYSTVENCYNTGNVSGSTSYRGGLIGYNYFNNTVNNCYSIGTVNGAGSFVGGLIGYNYTSTVTNSFWNTTTSGQGSSDGGTGKTTTQMQDIATYTSTATDGLDTPWDFVGDPFDDSATDDYWKHFDGDYPMLQWQDSAPVLSTTTASSITQNSALSGGEVLDDGNFSVTVRGVCWSTSAGPTTSDNITTNGTGEGAFSSSLTGLDTFTKYYYRAYATNSNDTSYGEEYSFVTLPLGSGTSGDPYHISSLTDLRTLSESNSFWSSHFIQTADIDAFETEDWYAGAGFSPIGNSTVKFTGSYDGDGHEIAWLKINRPSSNYIGVFGFIDSADITNLGLAVQSIFGNDYVGGLVGKAYNSNISDCYSYTMINADQYIGGLVGEVDNTVLTYCYSYGDIDGSFMTGGLVGRQWMSEIYYCHSNGSVSGTEIVGGLVGLNNTGEIYNSFSTSNVTGNIFIGGLVAENFSNSSISDSYSTGNVDGDVAGGFVGENQSSVISYCYSTGSVNGSLDIGGFAGHNSEVINNSFWDIDMSGQVSSAGGTGKTTTEMQDVTTFTSTATAGLDSPWDFVGDPNDDSGSDDHWKHFDGEYPMLEWEESTPIVTTALATDITAVSVILGGEVLSEGAPVTMRGVCLSDSPNPSIYEGDPFTDQGSGSGAFSDVISGFSECTKMYYRAFAYNSLGVSYGEEYSFTTTAIGSGTSGDPFLISNLQELRWLSEQSDYWGSNFIQTADIDASDTENWNSGAGFSPIGNPTVYFTGTYDGDRYEISDLFINRSDNDFQALFGSTAGATISDLGVTNVDITGLIDIGVLVGYASLTAISNCYSSGTVTGGWHTGGLVGTLSGSEIFHSYSASDVYGSDSSGGLVGYNTDVALTSNSYSSGSVNGDSNTGGLVGYNNNGAFISNCYSTGSVNGDFNTGGLVGQNDISTVANSFWDVDASGQSGSDGGTGLSTDEMQTLNTFIDAGWDFIGESANGNDEIWKIIYYDDHDSYPMLHWQNSAPFVSTTTASSVTRTSAILGGEVFDDGNFSVTVRGVCWSTSPGPTTSDNITTNGTGEGVFSSLLTGLEPFSGYYYSAYATNSLGTSYGEEYLFNTLPLGSGTPEDPYQIPNLFALGMLSESSPYWNSNFIQTADIDASETSSWNGGQGFSPIGNNSTRFTGTYDGNGYKIINLFLNRSGNDYQTLFGFIDGSSISNLGVVNVEIFGDDNLGGLVGKAENSTISKCFSSGSVSGDNTIGGLLGYHTDSTILDCYSTCSVNGNIVIGGFVGYNNGSSSISNSFSTGFVNGSETGNNHGGFVGYTDNSNINNSFWDTDTSGQDDSPGGTGKTTVEMKDEATYTSTVTDGLDTSWDFILNPNDDTGIEDIWNIDGMYNDGYPFLSWEYVPGPRNVAITIVGNDVMLSWDDMGASLYNIYRSTNPYTDDWGDPIGSSAVNSYTDNGAASEDRYFYYITISD